MTDLPFDLHEQLRRFRFAWDSIHGFGSHMDFWSFYQTVVTAAPASSTIVEVGCYQGRSLICLGLMAREANKDLRIVGVDNDAMHSNSVLVENVQKSGLTNVGLILEESTVAAKDFETGSCFLVFIDGGHLHDLVEADIRAWMPKVGIGGWLAGHDFQMHTVSQPAIAIFGDRLIYDERWQDVWIVPKCVPAEGVDIRHCPGRLPDFTESWRP